MSFFDVANLAKAREIVAMYPQAKSVFEWIREGWHVIMGYAVGFFVLMITLGWNPHAPHR